VLASALAAPIQSTMDATDSDLPFLDRILSVFLSNANIVFGGTKHFDLTSQKAISIRQEVSIFGYGE
jgi:hypothetical protein